MLGICHLCKEESGFAFFVTSASEDTASPGHMLLYILIDITALWNVRKCVVLASASSRPMATTREDASDFFVPWPHFFLPAGAPFPSNPPLQTSPTVRGFRLPTVAPHPSPFTPTSLTPFLTPALRESAPRVLAPSSAHTSPAMDVSTQQAQ